MPHFEWHPEYSVKVKLIDDQHKYFVSLLNELYESVENSSHTMIIDRILDQLEKYAEFHFATEEKYFAEFNYEYTLEHIAEHRALTEDVKKYIAERPSNEEDLYVFCKRVIAFLREWLINHLIEQDMKYSACFNANGLK